jgi:predicted Holliday junction resolvase-like endonuclease
MGFVILLIVALMILFVVTAFIVGLVQKAQRKNDVLTKKTKLLEMYAAEEKAREQAEAEKKRKEENKQ